MSKKKGKGGKAVAGKPAVEGKIAGAKAKGPKAPAKKEKPKKEVDLTPLREAVKQAEANLEAARVEYNALQKKAQEVIITAKTAYHVALVPYRNACKKAGVECEFTGGKRSPNVADRVSFLVEKVDKGVKVVIKGRSETEEVIPNDVLKKGVTRAAYAYTDKHIGPKEEIGNKGGGLSNRLRAVCNS